jgi:hypothetical protein
MKNPVKIHGSYNTDCEHFALIIKQFFQRRIFLLTISSERQHVTTALKSRDLEKQQVQLLQTFI